MALYYGRHKVLDYSAWRPLFDADQERIARIGARIMSVTRCTEDPNEVHFIFDIADLPLFVNHLQDPAMAEGMAQAGVLEPPVFYALQDIKL